jgi:uncharacterized membrane protein
MVDAGSVVEPCGSPECCCRNLPEKTQGRGHESLDRTFRITLVLKGLDGLLEMIGGVLLLTVSPASIEHVVRFFTAHELANDPHDFIASHLLHSASQLTGSATVYGGIYLLSHGIAKAVLVVLVLKDKLWAYPLLIALLLVFIVYQVYRLSYKLSFGLLFLTVFDLLVVGLTWREYRIKRRMSAQPALAQA